MDKLMPPCKPKDLCFVFYKDHYAEEEVFEDAGPPSIVINCCVGWVREWDEVVEVFYEKSTTGQLHRTVVLRGDLVEIRPVIKRRQKKTKSQLQKDE